jgi:CRP/FNR family transcriptional regulator, cyclic AMP receptor protein
MATKGEIASFDPDVFLATVNHGRTLSEYCTGRVIFSQGDAADSVFYIVRGKIKIAVTSEQGREAVVALLGARTFSAKAV